MTDGSIANCTCNRSVQRVFANARAGGVVQQATRDVDGCCDGQLVGRLVEQQPWIANQHSVVIEDDLLIGRVAGRRHRLPGTPVPDEQVIEVGIEHHHACVSGSEDGCETAYGGVAGYGKAVAGCGRRSFGRVIDEGL